MNVPRLGRALPAVLFALALLTAPPAHAASNWAAALPADAVGSYLPGSGLRVLVAAAGQGADPAATALTASLRALSTVKMTMPDDALGDLSAADDAAIVAKAKALPVDLVAVVRVFPGNGGAENVVATLYRVDGSVASAFTAGTDAPLVAQKSSGVGMAGATATAVEAVVGGHSADLDARVKEFEDRAIWMQGYAAVDARSGRIVSTWSVPMQGRYGEALSGPKFYEYLGRPDDAATFRKRQTVRVGTMIGGIAGVGAGGALLLAMRTDPYGPGGCDRFYDEDYFETPASDRCYADAEKQNAMATLVGGGVMGLGTIAIMVPLFIDPHPVKTNERSRLVDEHNEKLREELGLPKVRPTSLGATLSVGGWADGDVAGARVAGTF
ncbi:MAG: hypothetical protein ACK4YP_12965 [Myxococcota bacterium]